MTDRDEAVKAIRQARDAVFDALPKVGEPESIWCEVRGEHIRTLLAALDRAEEDARRYRWLRASRHNIRDTADFGFLGFPFDCTDRGYDASKPNERAEALDAAIDSALTPGAAHD